MARPRHELLASMLPPLAFVGVEWAMWGRRNELSGWGVEVDAGALGVAFVVAFAFGGAMPKLDRSWPDALLLRLANACVYSIGAAVCAFVCGLMRLRMIDLASLAVPPAELVLVRTGVIFVTAVGASYGVAIGLSNLAPRRAFVLAFATIALAALSAWHMSTTGSVRFEALRTEPTLAVELDALTMEVATRPLPARPVGDSQSGAGVSVERRVSDRGCTVRVSVDGRELWSDDHYPRSNHERRLCDPVRVSRSELDIVSVGVGAEEAELWFRYTSVKAVHVQDVEPAITPPRLWSTLAWSGVGASALLVALASLELLRLRTLRVFVAAEHVGGGMIILADERRFTAASATGLESGPVMLRGKLPAESHAGYRERADLATTALEIRSAAAHEHDLERRGERVRAASVAALTLTFSSSVLLIAAWLLGFGH